MIVTSASWLSGHVSRTNHEILSNTKNSSELRRETGRGAAADWVLVSGLALRSNS